MFQSLPTPILIATFAAAGAVVLAVSVRMTRLSDCLADRAGLGEAIAGGLVLGGATSLSGLTVSVSAAWSGDASLAFADGIAAQTAFLVAADMAFRRANLFQAATPKSCWACRCWPTPRPRSRSGTCTPSRR